MLIDMAVLPPAVQAQILAIQAHDTVQFTQDGQIIKELHVKNDSFVAAAGLLKAHNIDGLVYERQVRGEWDRPWDNDIGG